MQEFFENVLRYPTYMLALILGVFISVYDWLKPTFFKNRITTIATVGVFAGMFAFLYFTLRAMLGITVVSL